MMAVGLWLERGKASTGKVGAEQQIQTAITNVAIPTSNPN
jgi:hypothetical protein